MADGDYLDADRVRELLEELGQRLDAQVAGSRRGSGWPGRTQPKTQFVIEEIVTATLDAGAFDSDGA
jgi:hypothetical protein